MKQEKKHRLKNWWKSHKPTKRRLIQLYAALLTNANIKGFVKGQIYAGGSKQLCVPGLNCYSCPGAVGACPLGALQNALASSGTRAPYYVLGILILFGLLLGRAICGFLCPVGLGQELLYKIKTPKVRKSRFTRLFSYLKYIILAVFAVALPLLFALRSTAVPAFCKYICPAGTFGGAIFLLIHPDNAAQFAQLGPLFAWKMCLLIAIVVASVFFFRFFCRFLCPLGAIYGLFNRIALLGVKLDKNKCTDCGLCISHCKMDVKRVGDHECINCGECIDVCPAKAISFKGSKLFLHANAVPAAEERPLGALLAAQAPAGPSEVITMNESATGGMPETTPENIPENTPENAPENAPEQTPKKRRPLSFWLQLGAWGLALAVLVAALCYYNIPRGSDPLGGGDALDQTGRGNELFEKCYDFRLDGYNGAEQFTLSEHEGEVVLINFWATWCGPCVAEMPILAEWSETYDMTVVAIHSRNITTAPATSDGVQAWLDAPQNGVRWSEEYSKIVFLQDTGKDELTSDTFVLLGGNATYPMTVLVDREGIIRYHYTGPIHGVAMTQMLAILEEIV